MMPILESRKIFIKKFTLALALGFLVLIFLWLSWSLILNIK
jgi:hypothetical protein